MIKKNRIIKPKNNKHKEYLEWLQKERKEDVKSLRIFYTKILKRNNFHYNGFVVSILHYVTRNGNYKHSIILKK